MLKWTAVVALVATLACTASPVAPTPPPVPSCQSNNTAELSLRNTSPNGYTFDVLIDNINRGTIAPQQLVGPFTLTASIDHAIVSRITNTSVIACSSTTSFASCSTQTLNCSH